MLEHIGEVAYRLVLMHSLLKMHPMFHLSLLRRYVADPSHQILYEDLELCPNLSYEEEVVWILDHCSKTLCQKEVALVKVFWSKHGVEEVTWKRGDEMR